MTVLDYGMGNLGSVSRALQHLGAVFTVSDSAAGASKLIIPGVGAFAAAMEAIRSQAETIRALASDGVPILGICLGQQLLFDESEEGSLTPGLGLLRGRVRYLPTDGVKVPHIGWNALTSPRAIALLNGIPSESEVYFVHSLYTDCADAEDIAAETTHGISFPSAVQRGNIWGVQFHPEKSGDIGLQILENFVRC